MRYRNARKRKTARQKKGKILSIARQVQNAEGKQHTDAEEQNAKKGEPHFEWRQKKKEKEKETQKKKTPP